MGNAGYTDDAAVTKAAGADAAADAAGAETMPEQNDQDSLTCFFVMQIPVAQLAEGLERHLAAQGKRLVLEDIPEAPAPVADQPPACTPDEG